MFFFYRYRHTFWNSILKIYRTLIIIGEMNLHIHILNVSFIV